MKNQHTLKLNADIGEGSAFDAALLPLIDAANIACGFHAGHALLMQQTVQMAMQYGVQIGAHPGFNDPENFGRKVLNVPANTIYSEVLYQVGALAAIVQASGGKLVHVKPHGALYNQAAQDKSLALAIGQAVKDYNPELILVGLANSPCIVWWKALGLTVESEAFADRTYLANGQLMPRTESGAVLHDTEAVLAQVQSLLQTGTVKSSIGEPVNIHADTLCVHGDNPAALALTQSIRVLLKGC